jgi:hypothetical protein
MAVNIKLKRSAVPGNVPDTSQLELGEIALNTHDGKAFFKQDVNGLQSIVELASFTSGSSVASASYAAYAANAGTANTASYVNNAISSSFATTASYAPGSDTATSASYAATASSANNFLVRGTLTAQTIVAQYITSSTSFITGSTKFGSIISNTHEFTGSISVSGSLGINGIDYGTTSASFDTRINNNSSSIAILSASLLGETAAIFTILSGQSSSISSLSSSFLAFSSSYNTGSFSGSFSGSLFGSASWALDAVDTINAPRYTLTSSFQNFTQSYYSDSASVSTRVTNLEQFSSSLDATFATDAQLNDATASLSGSISYLSASFLIDSASFNTRINNNSSSIDLLSGSYLASSSSFDTRIINNSSSIGLLSGSYLASSSSFDTRIINNSSSIALLSGSYLADSSSFDTRILNNSSSIGLLSGSYLASSASFDTRIINNSSSIGLLSGSYLASSASFDTRIINNSSSIALLSGSYLSDSASFNTRINNNSSSIGLLSGSYLASSASFDTRILNNSSSIGSLSGSFLSVSSSNSTRISNLEQFSSSLDTIFATDADLNALSSSFNTFSSSINSWTGSSTSQFGGTASYSNTSISASYAATASSADNFLVRGTLTAQTIIAQYITSSVEFVTGSTHFGTTIDNTHQFTGSVSISGSLGINGIDYASTSASFDTRILNNSSSIGLLSGSYLASSSSFDTRIINNSSSIGLLSGSYLASSASFDTRILNNSSSIGLLSGSYLASSASFDTRILNNSSSIGLLSGSYLADSASFDTRILNNSSSIGSLSGSFLSVSSSNSIRITDLEAFSSSLDATYATDAQLNAATASLSSSIAILSSSYTSFSSSFSTGSFTGSFNGDFTGSLNNLQGTARHIPFFSSSQVLDDSSIYQVGNESVAINQNAVTTAAPEALYVWQPNTSSFNVISGKGNLDNYLQLNIQNTNQGSTASSDIVATANNGNEFSNYINMGINSENFSGFLGGPNDAYIYTTGSEFHIGNITPGKHLGFFVGGGDVDAGNKFALYPTNEHQMTGSLDVSGSVKAFSFTGSLLGDVTGSLFGTASWALNSITASYANVATSASYAFNATSASFASSGNGIFSGSFSGSFSGNGNGLTNIPASSVVGLNLSQISSGSVTASVDPAYGFKVNANTTISGSTQITGSLGVTGSVSIAGTGTVLSANVDTIVFTGSFAQSGSVTINGNITSTGTITAQTLNVQTITSSVSFITGSSKFGSIISNTHQFTGSILVSGSLAVNDSNVILTNQTSSMSVLSASFASTASYVTLAQTASYITLSQTSSYVTLAQTASYVANAQTASYVLNAISASYTLNADLFDGKDSTTFATTGSNTFIGTQTVTGSLFTSGSNSLVGNTILSGSVNISGSTNIFGTTNFRNSSTTITGSLLVSGSTTQTGNNTLTGNTLLSGSINISGSISASADITLGGYFRLDPGQDPGPSNVTASYLFTSGSNTATGFDLYYRQNNNLVKFKWLEGGLSSGILYGGGISYSGSTIFVKKGSGIINNMNASTGSEINPIITYVNWNDYTASVQNLTSSQNTYLYVDASGSIFQQTSFFNQVQYEQAIPLGRVTHPNYVSITGVGSNVQTTYDSDTQQNDFIRAFGPIKVSGFAINVHTGSLGFGIGGGTAYNLGGFYTQDPNDPSHYTSVGFATASIARAWRSGSGVYLDNNGGSFYNTVDPDYWDDGTGTLNTMAAGDWQIQRVFANPVTGRVVVYYGQTGTYTTLLNALQYLATDPFEEGEFTAKSLVFVGYLVLKGQTNNLADSANNAIINAGIFRNIAGGSSGGGAVAQTLNDLSDVIITTPTQYQALVYDSGNWINGTPVSASFATTASYVSPNTQIFSSSFATTASYVSPNTQIFSSSFATTASYASTVNYNNTVITSSFAVTASYVSPNTQIYTSSFAITASYVSPNTQIFTSSFAITASYASTVDYNNTVATASFASTASYVSPFTEIYTSSFAVTASYVSPFTEIYTSSFAITASYVSPNTQINTSSFATTASYVSPNTQIFTSSFAITASYASTVNYNNTVISSSNAITASYAFNATTASYALTSSNVEGGNANYLPLWLNNTTLTSSIAYQNASGIGINNISPSHKLQVSGDAAVANTNSTLNTTKYALLSGLQLTSTGTESNQYANVGVYGALGFSATSSTFTPSNKSFTSAVLGQFGKSGNGNISGRVSSFASAFDLAGAGNVTTMAGFRAYAPLQSFALPSFTGTVTNYIGLLIDDITGTTDVSSQITNKYGIFQSGSLDKNYFAGATTFAGGITGSLLGNATTASYVLNAVSASNAATASYSQNLTVGSTLVIDQTLTDYATVASSIAGSNNVFTQNTGSYTSAFFKYTVSNGGNTRAGEVVATWNGTTTEFTDFSTVDIGNTTAVTASISIVSGQVQFNVQTNSSGWRIKSLATFM